MSFLRCPINCTGQSYSLWRGTTQRHERKGCRDSSWRLIHTSHLPRRGEWIHTSLTPVAAAHRQCLADTGGLGLPLTHGGETKYVISCFSTPCGVWLKPRPHPYSMSSCLLYLVSLTTFLLRAVSEWISCIQIPVLGTASRKPDLEVFKKYLK